MKAPARRPCLGAPLEPARNGDEDRDGDRKRIQTPIEGIGGGRGNDTRQVSAEDDEQCEEDPPREDNAHDDGVLCGK